MSNPVGKLRKKKDKSGVEQSFLDFLDDKNLYIEEQNKLWEFWKRGGAPFVKGYDKKGRASYKTSKINTYGVKGQNYGFYSFADDRPDTMRVYTGNPERDFLAEISHGIQYARKEGESDKDWGKRYRHQTELADQEEYYYDDENRYGRKMSPRNLKELLSEEKRGDEFPSGVELTEVPYGYGNWNQTYDRKVLWEEYDKSTGMGVKGSKPTREFEAHSVIQPGLESELSDVRQSIPGYKKNVLSDVNMMKWIKEGLIPNMVKGSVGMGITLNYMKSLMDYINEN